MIVRTVDGVLVYLEAARCVHKFIALQPDLLGCIAVIHSYLHNYSWQTTTASVVVKLNRAWTTPLPVRRCLWRGYCHCLFTSVFKSVCESQLVQLLMNTPGEPRNSFSRNILSRCLL